MMRTTGDTETMCEIKPLQNEVIVSNNFQELEEAIDEISETENISNEKEFFDSYKIKIMKLDQ
ncbi:hypothetical protein [Methanobrevibacter sp.]